MNTGLEGFMLDALQFLESDAAAVIILLVGVSVLWVSLKHQIRTNTTVLTERLNHCEERHGKCERQYRQLAEAIKDLLVNDRASAARNVEEVLQQRDEDDDEETH